MILLTGASGFIGGHILNALINSYGTENVVALTSKPLPKCNYLLHNGYNFDSNIFFGNGFEEIDTIVHAGAFIPKSGKESNQIELCNSNIYKTTKLLSVKFPKIKRIIFLSTIDVYGFDIKITEKTLIEPVSLYGYSKLYCEKLCSVWAEQYNISCQILRIGHVYGPGEEKYHKLIPLTMHRLCNGEKLQLFSDGNEIRSFIYIDDVVNAILKSILLRENPGIINIVGSKHISIKDLLEKILSISQSKAIIERIITTNKQRDLIFDNSKMKEFLINPQIDLDEGLKIEWEYMKSI